MMRMIRVAQFRGYCQSSSSGEETGFICEEEEAFVCHPIHRPACVGIALALIVCAAWGPCFVQGSPADAYLTTASVPFHRLDDGFQSDLVLSNNLDDPREVAVTVFNSEGEGLETAVPLDGHAVKSVSLSELLGTSAARWRRGHVEIRYEGSRYGLGAALKVSRPGFRLGYVEEFSVKSDASSTALSGLLWRPQVDTARASLVLTNTSDRSLKVRVAPEAGRVRPGVLRLDPHAQQTVEAEALVGVDGVPQAVTLIHDGSPGDLLAAGLVSDVGTGFSVAVSFSDSNRVERLRAVGPFFATPFGAATMSPHTALLVGANLEPRPVGGTGFVRCPSGAENSFPLEFRPRASTTVEVPPPLEAEDPRLCSLETELDRPADVVVRLFSLDATGDLSTEIELKRDGRAGVANGRYPFDLNADSSEVVVENLSDEPASFRGGIVYAGGVYILPVQTVEPGRNLLGGRTGRAARWRAVSAPSILPRGWCL